MVSKTVFFEIFGVGGGKVGVGKNGAFSLLRCFFRFSWFFRDFSGFSRFFLIFFVIFSCFFHVLGPGAVLGG